MSGFKINKRIKLILFGMLLGDAHLQTFSNGQTVRLRVLHSLKQRKYLEHKLELFKDLVRTKISFLEEKKNNRIYKKCYFNTITTNKLRFFFNSFYKNEKKVLPKLIHRYIEPLSMAYWYMDDGSLKWKNRSKAVRLCTDNFDKKEVIRLVEILNSKFNLNASVFKQRSRFRIYIPNENNCFTNLIREHIIESMMYKIPCSD